MDLVSELWYSMAITGKTVVIILAGLSIYSYAVMVDRGLVLRWTRQRSAAFADEIEQGRGRFPTRMWCVCSICSRKTGSKL